MVTVLVVLQLTVCLLLIGLVLLQDPKGGAAGGIFGGSGSNSLLGATGATSFLVKVTRGAAIGFGILCLVLTWYLKRDTGSVIDASGAATSAGVPAGQPAPANPQSPAGNTTNGTTTVPADDAAAAPVPAEKK
jgi:preprotein translocase subunit SecG